MLLDIKKFPDKVLREKATPIEIFDNSLKVFIDNMFETMYDAPGIGLAANQVGVTKQVVVIDITAGDDTSQQKVFINPKIVAKSGEEEGEEGCLSVPGEYEMVTRFAEVTVEAQDVEGTSFSLKADGLLARAIQHELDHLDGKLFVDRLSSLKRDMVKKRIKKRIASDSY